MIRITEVGPRDGLQNEAAKIPTDAKVAYINALSGTGVTEIEVSSFVSPRWVPQLADATEVFEQIERKAGVTYSALVPNQKGLERALAADVDKISVFTAASEFFNQRNINAGIKESIERFVPVVEEARAHELSIRGYVSVGFWCPYEGKVAPEAVLEVVDQLFDIGVDEVSIGDTIGRACPADIRALLEPLTGQMDPDRLVMHFHDTYGMALANAWVSHEEFGVTRYDSSAGGLGGCPYAPGATGNVATEDLVHMFEASGYEVEGDILACVRAARVIAPHIGHGLRSHLAFVVPPDEES